MRGALVRASSSPRQRPSGVATPATSRIPMGTCGRSSGIHSGRSSRRFSVRVAALYDIHGNLPALDAVLDEVRAADVDQIVVGGDVIPGPMVRETLDRLR